MNTACKTPRPIAPFAVPSAGDVIASTGVVSLFHRINDTLRLWQSRIKMRRHLLELDDHLLADIGLGRVAAEREATKAFWRA